eukprot:CAMPEP_0195574698 /NCGR_PEP_ID=MMETSP0814-20130614/6114_1 /TAXON_ID=97485 /ORGANISM="Prymnesium parvum, Strain Texoma1" /LENGTH=146 /DNA_ID=CAMNT_0040710723 /DNA_START=127 /DNA_END=564 /DNA_ORIENTATION=+
MKIVQTQCPTDPTAVPYCVRMSKDVSLCSDVADFQRAGYHSIMRESAVRESDKCFRMEACRCTDEQLGLHEDGCEPTCSTEESGGELKRFMLFAQDSQMAAYGLTQFTTDSRNSNHGERRRRGACRANAASGVRKCAKGCWPGCAR